MRDELQLKLKEEFPLTFARMFVMPPKVKKGIKRFLAREVYTSKRLGRNVVVAWARAIYLYLKCWVVPSYWDYRYEYSRPFHCMEAWGISCGDGWYKVIYDLCKELEPLIEALPEEERFYCAAVQVKEKFGGLRFYLDAETDEMSKVISKAERKSYETCEDCGAPGEQREGGWIVTLCDSCNKAYLERKGLRNNNG